jgi:HK97 gp10 family phage protein
MSGYGLDVSVLGFDDVAKKLKGSRSVLDKVSNEMLQMAIKMGEATAKKLSPVDTGTLRRSITSKTEKSDGSILGRVGTNTSYAIHQEYGTRYMRGKFFMKGALEDIKKNMGQVTSFGFKRIKELL